MEELMPEEEFDVVIVGSGGGGLACALAAADLGSRVIIIEASSQIGGTFGYSAGVFWVPNNHFMAEMGISDSTDEALMHIRELSGGRHSDAVTKCFLDQAPSIFRWLVDDMHVPFEPHGEADYYAERLGGKEIGRTIAPPVFRTQELLPAEYQSALVDAPHYAGLPVSWSEIHDWGGFAAITTWDWNEIARRTVANCRAFGSAAAGYMLAACLKFDIPIRLNTQATELVVTDGRVSGVKVVDADGKVSVIRGRQGVLLATGGYESNDALRERWDLYSGTYGLGSPHVNGSGMIMALEIGAGFRVFDGQLTTPTFHIPNEEADGRPLHRILIREPAYPGGIVVNAAGKRFADESFYRSLCQEMSRWDVRSQTFPNERTYLIFDQEWKDSYALGPISPGEVPAWVPHASSSEDLAALINVSPRGLETTIADFNSHAKDGHDPEYGRGTLSYSRACGDQRIAPNPNIRPLSGELYAIPLQLGSSGSNSGLEFDQFGRVIHLRGQPIPGLYAAGNVGANLVEGLWYNSGVSNSKAVTFGCIAARHMCGDPHRI
jgi:3-oxosteroid 1-dehydrogenase